MIIRARSLVTMDGPPIANGAVAVSGNRIADVGSFADVRGRNAGEVLDLGECALLPGLINAHCHLDYTCLRGQIAPQPSFADWIRAINERKAALTPEDYVRSIEAGFAEAAGFGTTTLVNLEAFPALLRRMDQPALRTWWFAEMIDVREAVSARAMHNEMRAKWPDGLHNIGLAPHAPFTASKDLYRESAAIGAAYDLPLTTHLAESREEMQMFREARGPLFEFMKAMGRPMEDCGAGTPLALMLRSGILNERWLVAHMNEIDPSDLQQLATARRFHVVHCPRSHAYFSHSPFARRQLAELGYNICVGTDSLASNHDLSLFRELRQLRQTEPSLAARELFGMVTWRAAAAIGQQDLLGRIRGGFAADLIAVPSRAADENTFEELLEFDQQVPWIMVDGKLLTRP